MRRHYKLKHPYVFHTETEKSKKNWTRKSKEKVKNKEIGANQESKACVETKIRKKRRSTLWQRFIDVEKGFISCKICNMKLRDRHYIAVLHLNRRHPKALAELGDFNVMPFKQKNHLLWDFFIDEGNKLARCVLCGITMRKNMSKHLQREHPDAFEQAMDDKKEIKITKYREPHSLHSPRVYKWVKKYCSKIADKQYQCNECEIMLRIHKGFFGNMSRHIRIKHPSIYHKETKIANSGKVNTAVRDNFVDPLQVDGNSNALSLRDPLADFNLCSPAISETDVAANFLQNDNLTRNISPEIDLNTIAELPSLEPNRDSETYDKSYFILEDDGQYKCIQCEEMVNCPDIDEQEFLFTHIRDNHPEEIMTLQATSTENDDEYQVVVLVSGTKRACSARLVTMNAIIGRKNCRIVFDVPRCDLTDCKLPTTRPSREKVPDGASLCEVLIPQLYPEQRTSVCFKYSFNILYASDWETENHNNPNLETQWSFAFPPPLLPPPPPPPLEVPLTPELPKPTPLAVTSTSMLPPPPPPPSSPPPPSPQESSSPTPEMLTLNIPLPKTPPPPPPLPLMPPPLPAMPLPMPLPSPSCVKPKQVLYSRYSSDIKKESDDLTNTLTTELQDPLSDVSSGSLPDDFWGDSPDDLRDDFTIAPNNSADNLRDDSQADSLNDTTVYSPDNCSEYIPDETSGS